MSVICERIFLCWSALDARSGRHGAQNRLKFHSSVPSVRLSNQIAADFSFHWFKFEGQVVGRWSALDVKVHN